MHEMLEFEDGPSRLDLVCFVPLESCSGSIPGLGRSLGEGNGYPLQYSGLEYSMGSQRVEQD